MHVVVLLDNNLQLLLRVFLHIGDVELRRWRLLLFGLWPSLCVLSLGRCLGGNLAHLLVSGLRLLRGLISLLLDVFEHLNHHFEQFGLI